MSMFVGYKIFDITISILLVGAITWLLQNPSNRQFFIAGLCIGVAAVFGRNHGIYGLAGCIAAMAWLRIRQIDHPTMVHGAKYLLCGIAAGFSPIIVMALFIPGFAFSFWDSILYLFKLKTTNIPLPVPWPWLALRNITLAPIEELMPAILIGIFFVSILYFAVRTTVTVFWQEWRNKPTPPALVAAALFGPPYEHYAFSRADIFHLSFGIFPFLFGCMVALAPKPRLISWPVSLVLCAAIICLLLPYHAGFQCRVMHQCVSTEISGSQLYIDLVSANAVRLLRAMDDQVDGDFICAPLCPTACAILDRRSPMWEIYPLLPRRPEFEKTEIDRIKAAKPAYAFIIDFALDGREELRFRHTHPMINQYIVDNLVPIANSTMPEYQVYIAKSYAATKSGAAAD